MRDYVLTTSCRREFLMNYFNFPLDSEQHDKDTCCDNCSNLPSDNSKQTTWQVNSALKDCCFVSLTQSVARALSSEPEKFTSAAQLSQAYPKLCPFKLDASLHSLHWVQIRVAVRKHSNRVKFDYYLPSVTMKFYGWPWKTIGHLFYTHSSFMYYLVNFPNFQGRRAISAQKFWLW